MALPGTARAGGLAAFAAGLRPAGAAAVTAPHPALSAAGWLCAGLVAAQLYLLPVLIGWIRQVPGLGTLTVLDVTLGWTGIGWLLALRLALRPARPARSRAAGTQAPPPAGREHETAAGRRPGDAPPLRLRSAADDAS
jgi:hypothetical protein